MYNMVGMESSSKYIHCSRYTNTFLVEKGKVFCQKYKMSLFLYRQSFGWKRKEISLKA